MPRKSDTTTPAILAAGYKITKAHPGGRWFEVERAGVPALLLKHRANCWHWFGRDVSATASGPSAAAADAGGLGDVVDGDTSMRTYRQLLSLAPLVLVARYAGLSTARSQIRK